MRNSYDFKFGDFWLSELGGMMTESPTIEIASRDVSFIDIPGKDGKDLVDNGRYDNVEFSRSIAFISKPGFNVKEKIVKAIDNIAYIRGYSNFEDTDHPDMFTKAAITNFSEINKTLRSMNTAELQFSRIPYWYSKVGQEEVDLLSSSVASTKIYNPYGATCKPLIKVYFNYTSGSISTGKVVITIWTNINGEFFSFDINIPNTSIDQFKNVVSVDLDSRQVYLQDYSGRERDYIDIEIPAELGQGEITFIRGLYQNLNKVSVIPRWRCL